MPTDSAPGQSPETAPAPNPGVQRLRLAIRWLAQTSSPAGEPQRQQARLMVWLILGSLVVTVLALAVFQLIPGFGEALSPLALLIVLASFSMLGLAFWLNRAGQSQRAAWLVVLVFCLGTWGIVLADQPNYLAHPELRSELLFPLVAILLSGLLLPAWATGVWAAANMLGLLLFASQFALAPSFNLAGLIVFYTFISLLSGLAGELRRRDLAQLEAQTRALAISEAEYRRIVDLAQEGIWILDAGHHTRFVNRKMADLLGHTEAEMIGGHVSEFEDEQSKSLAASLERRRSGTLEQEDFMLRHRDGSHRWVILSNAPLTDTNGAYTGAVLLVTDVTRRREVEDNLRQSQALFHSAFAYAAIGMSVVDMAGRYIQVNDALCRLVGYSEAELLATTYLKITHPDDVELDAESARRLFAGEISTFQIEKRYVHKQGHVVWVLLTVSLVRGAAGAIVYNVAQVQDITAQRRDSESLRESSERYRQMLAEAEALRQFNDSIAEVMAEGLMLQDASGLITLVNPKLQAMLGYSAAELIGLHATSLVVASDRDLVSRHAAKRPAGTTSNYEARLLTKDRRELPVLISATPLIKDSRFAGTLATLTDISSRVQAEAALKEANTQLTGWLAELEERTREIGLLNEMSELLQTSLVADEAYGVVSQMMPALFPGSAGRIYLIKELRNLVEAVTQWGPVQGEPLPFTPSECWGLRRGRLYAVENLGSTAASVVCQHLPPPWPHSYQCVPMVAQGETVGVLHLQQVDGAGAALQPGSFWTNARQQLARTVADSVGLALANLRLRDSLRQQSIRDPLTGLFNRRYLEETLERELSRAGREKQTVGVLMIDIDHFKQFNDAWGHAAGDRLLRDFGALLRSHLRAGDIACRYGGEEFTLILPGASGEVTAGRAEHLVTAVANLRHDGDAPAGQGVTISVGIASFPDHGASGADVMRAADVALYQAKHAGRNRFALAI